MAGRHRGADRAPRRAAATPGPASRCPARATRAVDDRDRRRARRRLTSGGLTARVARGERLAARLRRGRPGADLAAAPKTIGLATGPDGDRYVHEQLDLGVGEHGLRAGRAVRPARQERPVGRHLERRRRHQQRAGLQERAVLPDQPRATASSSTTRSRSRSRSARRRSSRSAVLGRRARTLEYFVIHGPTPKEILRKYTALTGRPAAGAGVVVRAVAVHVVHHRLRRGDRHAASSTAWPSATCRCSVFHFDCFWMREFHWCDFEWDPRDLPRPGGDAGPAARRKGLRICVWINPYIAQRSPLFEEGRAQRLPGDAAPTAASGSGTSGRPAWRWSTSPTPPRPQWYSGASCERAARPGRRRFKTDFGERIPTDVVWLDGSDPRADAQLLHAPVQPDRLRPAATSAAATGEAVLFARSATAGGQQFPVHWGGDCESTFESMAETLRGGLSLARQRLRLLEPRHRRLRGHPGRRRCSSAGWRSACCPVAQPAARLRLATGCRGRSTRRPSTSPRRFTQLKMSLMPYLSGRRGEAHGDGRADAAADGAGVPGRPGDRAPRPPVHARRRPAGRAGVLAPTARCAFYVPGGHLDAPAGRRARSPARAGSRETHGFDSLPLLVRPGAVHPVGAARRPAGLRLRRRRHAAAVRHRRADRDDGAGAGARRRARRDVRRRPGRRRSPSRRTAGAELPWSVRLPAGVRVARCAGADSATRWTVTLRAVGGRQTLMYRVRPTTVSDDRSAITRAHHRHRPQEDSHR